MRWTVLLVLAVLSGCAHQVVIPPTKEGAACYRQCLGIWNSCNASAYGNDWVKVGCNNQERDCFLSCPGAYEAS